MSLTSNLRPVPERFAVAFSLSAGDRDLVDAIALEVERRLGRGSVFTAAWYEHLLAGNDADVRLQDIHTMGCELAVVCVSDAYARDQWAQVEHEAIRSRRARAGSTAAATLSVLPIRIASGEVPGLNSSALIPDARGRSTDDVADLIIGRLVLLRETFPSPPTQTLWSNWPNVDINGRWTVANHGEIREQVASLLRNESATRVLMIQAPAEGGKSCISEEMISFARQLTPMRCGRFDFKGTLNMSIQIEVFARALGILVPTEEETVPALRQILNDLNDHPQPTFLVVDTFEAAPEPAIDWVENVLVDHASVKPWLRVAILGQSVPRRHRASGNQVKLLTELPPPDANDWFEYARTNSDRCHGFTLDDIRAIYADAAGAPSLVATRIHKPEMPV